jgi:Methyltransferase domain
MLADDVAALDTRLFSYVECHTSGDDLGSLLAIHNGVATRTNPFSYLEIGSAFGGTLQVLIADPRCSRIVSIDPRPEWQPDDRPGLDHLEYPDNSTERMLGLLEGVPDAEMSKLETIEASTEDIEPAAVSRPDLCFIDGEHTFRAALRDARFCREVMQGRGIVAFHDFYIVEPAIREFLRETPGRHRSYLLSNVFVVELGGVPTLIDDPQIRRYLRPRHGWKLINLAGMTTLALTADIQRRGRKGRAVELTNT